VQFDKKYLNIALFHLEKIIGSSYPNPPVFSILVESNRSFSDNKIVSFGFTSAGGRPHAEANAIMKVASSTQSCSGATVYVTLSPCKDCSKLIYQAGIVRVVYIDQYKDTTGIDFLKDAGVEVVQIANPY